MPAAIATACSSAMPTSKKRLGKRDANRVRPVPDGMAAVIAQMRASFSAKAHSSRPKQAEKSSFLSAANAPDTGSNLDTPWYFSGSCSLGA